MADAKLSAAERSLRAEARRLVARSRGYGWFRPNPYAPEGYRLCPACDTRIGGEARGVVGDDRVAAAINRAIDQAMIEHLLDPDDGCLRS